MKRAVLTEASGAGAEAGARTQPVKISVRVTTTATVASSVETTTKVVGVVALQTATAMTATVPAAVTTCRRGAKTGVTLIATDLRRVEAIGTGTASVVAHPVRPRRRRLSQLMMSVIGARSSFSNLPPVSGLRI